MTEMYARSRVALWCVLTLLPCPVDAGDDDGRTTTSTDITPTIEESMPERPAPVLELGERFLGRGQVVAGIPLPSGAVWQPALLVFGTHRTALDSRNDGGGEQASWSNRLDLFVNLRLTGTERVLVGIRPLDDDGAFAGFTFRPRAERGWQSAGSARLQTLFFEGELGELFPRLDIDDRHTLDIGFSVGRQPLHFQEGLLIDDTVDAIGVTRNTLLPRDASNLRVTAIAGWADVHRVGDERHSDASLFGLFAQLDTARSTFDLDLAVVREAAGGGDSIHVGLSAVQRIGRLNTALRLLESKPLRAGASDIGNGTLLFAEMSWTPGVSHDLLYANGFAAHGRYTPAARDPLLGGPLARTGILFSAASVGRYSAALDASATDAQGLAVGYQKLFRDGRTQLIVELGARRDAQLGEIAAAVGIRLEQAIGRRFLLRLDGFDGWRENGPPGRGGRVELVVKF